MVSPATNGQTGEGSSLRVVKVSKDFPLPEHGGAAEARTLALDGVSVSVAAGELVSIIGPSGCGKSTLLRLIAGLTAVSAGEIVVDGMTPANARELMFFVF